MARILCAFLMAASLCGLCAVSDAGGAVLGGKKPLTEEDAEMVGLAVKAAVAHYNAISNTPFQHILRVVQPGGTKQVVSGVKYLFTAELDETSCSKGTEVTDACRAPTHVKAVDFSVVAQPWRLQAPYVVAVLGEETL